MKDICASCKKMCCKADISFSPVLSDAEISNIEAFQTKNNSPLRNKDDFCFFDAESKTYRLKKLADNSCVFWNSQTRGCSIYAARPLDCKIFPLEYRWFTWMHSPHCPSDMFKKDKMLAQFDGCAKSEIKALKLMHLQAPESTKDKFWIFILKVLPLAKIYAKIFKIRPKRS